MKDEALKLAEQLEDDAKYGECDWTNPKVSADMIRRLVEELDNKSKPLSDEEITYQFQHKCPRFSRLDIFKYAVKWAEERHGIK